MEKQFFYIIASYGITAIILLILFVRSYIAYKQEKGWYKQHLNTKDSF